MTTLKQILLISGKRKCGKDYISEKLKTRLGERCQIVHISEPIKAEWARKMQLDLDQLLGDGPYKEKYRKDMIVWSDQVRQRDYGYFCRVAMEGAHAEIIIVSDIRRINDIRFFMDTYGDKVLSVRLTCPEEVRSERGWLYTTGIDDVESECGLDGYDKWDLVVENINANDDQLIGIIIDKLYVNKMSAKFSMENRVFSG